MELVTGWRRNIRRLSLIWFMMAAIAHGFSACPVLSAETSTPAPPMTDPQAGRPSPVEPQSEARQQAFGRLLRSPEWALVWVTVALVVVTGLLSVYTALLYRSTKRMALDADAASKRALQISREAADAALRSAEIARTSSVAAYRPWLRITITPVDEFFISLDENGDAEILGLAEVLIENIGVYPAQHVQFFSETLDARANVSRDVLRSFATIYESGKDETKSLGYTVFPTEKRIEISRITVSRSPGGGYSLVGMVGYKHSLQSNVFYTTFSVTVGLKDEYLHRNRVFALLDAKEIRVPASDIVFRPNNADDGLTV